MEILQLPIQALQERIEKELNENPLLDISEEDPDLPDSPADRENPDAPSDEEKELVVDETKDNADDFERWLNMEEQWPGEFEGRTRQSASRMEMDADRKHDAMANVAARSESLQEHLTQQLGELELDDALRQMAQRIVSTLDSNGYLRGRLEDLLPANAAPDQLALAQQGLDVVQTLDPLGVGARDLRECLLLQLEPGISFYEELKMLISDHLEDLGDNRLPAIERKTGYSIETIQAAWREVRKLNPKPGANYADTFVPTVTPDVIVERSDDGSYKVRLEDGRTPSLHISNHYRQRLLSGNASDEEKEFIRRKVNSAQWLIDSIQQRRNTLTRVAQAIVDHQTRFLDEGPEAIEPLKMQQIADKVGVHVTTVSRAVDDKWIQAPRGIYALRRFFVGGTVSEGGEEVAWDAIRLRLQELVGHEDKRSPHSDDELVRELKNHGLSVARRTVTKYRQKMGIPSSRQRRDWSKVDGKKKPPTQAQDDTAAGP